MRLLSLTCLILISSTQSAFAKIVKDGRTKVVANGEISSDVITVAEDGVIFEQHIRPTDVVSLPEGAEIFIRKTGNASVRIEQNTKLFLVENKKADQVFCSYGPAYFVKPGIGKPFDLQACFKDSDNSGSFDVLYLSEKGQLDFPPMAHSRLRMMKTSFDPIAYSASGSDENLSQPIRLTLNKIRKNEARFEIEALTAEGDWVRQARSEKSLGNLPQTIEVFGSKIEVQKTAGDSLMLKPISGLGRKRAFYFSGDMMYSKDDLEYVMPK